MEKTCSDTKNASHTPDRNALEKGVKRKQKRVDLRRDTMDKAKTSVMLVYEGVKSASGP